MDYLVENVLQKNQSLKKIVKDEKILTKEKFDIERFLEKKKRHMIKWQRIKKEMNELNINKININQCSIK